MLQVFRVVIPKTTIVLDGEIKQIYNKHFYIKDLILLGPTNLMSVNLNFSFLFQLALVTKRIFSNTLT